MSSLLASLTDSHGGTRGVQARVLADVVSVLRHDRWKDKSANRWTGKVEASIQVVKIPAGARRAH